LRERGDDVPGAGRNGERRLADDSEKPLVEVCGAPMLDRVLGAIRESRSAERGAIEAVHAVVSPHAPATAERARELSHSVIETPGDGYVADLGEALDVGGEPALTVPADLPLLAPEHVDNAVERARSGSDPRVSASDDDVSSLAVCVPAALKRRLGASIDTAFDHDGRDVAPTGLNVVAGDDDTVALTYDARLAVNVNRPADVELAEALCE
jgi:adenosylcobinamide-phosphate guanylyltransferase